ncbi:MAG: nicotinate-nucleotide adenylyltransferase [Caldilineaceae bacterium]|nr:nicotinate-nucleotide adenylyltransferase [Caldilineaceae bacterium]
MTETGQQQVINGIHSREDGLSALTPERGSLRIGIFGGTFDPIHVGHLILAEEAWFQLKLDRVYLVPAGDPPHKQNRRLAGVEHRIRMAQLATADSEYIRVSRVDADRPGPHFTADMVRLVRQRVDSQVELYFLMGMDSLGDLPNWREAQWLVENCRLVALSRHDVEIDWESLNRLLPGIREKVIILDMPELEIASNIIQRRVRSGQPIRYQVPRLVERYIREHSLYTAASSPVGE